MEKVVRIEESMSIILFGFNLVLRRPFFIFNGILYLTGQNNMLRK